ncbi:MAG: hypothetical protein QM638_04870, partial [Nocardioides sp.]|uniref:hypothetical protein n=1 Tax=Nocardioides sp. TaxID=35761 RepID=UPI0039E57BDF
MAETSVEFDDDPEVAVLQIAELPSVRGTTGCLSNGSREPVGALDPHQVLVLEHGGRARGQILDHVSQQAAPRQLREACDRGGERRGGHSAAPDHRGNGGDRVDAVGVQHRGSGTLLPRQWTRVVDIDAGKDTDQFATAHQPADLLGRESEVVQLGTTDDPVLGLGGALEPERAESSPVRGLLGPVLGCLTGVVRHAAQAARGCGRANQRAPELWTRRCVEWGGRLTGRGRHPRTGGEVGGGVGGRGLGGRRG